MAFPFLKPLAAAAVAAAALVGAPAAHAGYTDMVVFGDSLSDDGNLLAKFGSPPAPYWQGRFSNGPVAVEQLGALMGAKVDNYAYGGAQTGFGNVNVGLDNTGVMAQLAEFQATLNGGAADSKALYVVWAGPNDLWSANAQNAQALIGGAITNLVAAVSTLHAWGARDFLLPLLPDLGSTPNAQARGAQAMAQYSQIAMLFNQNLRAAYGQLAASWTDEKFYIFDSFAAQRESMAAQAAAGIDTVTPCLTDAGVCTDASARFFWDWVHPTSTTHTLTAYAMLNEVPEPSTVALIGVAALGLALRRRAKTS